MAYRFRRGRGQFTAPTSRSGRGYVYAGRSVRLKGDNFELTWNGPQIAVQIMDALVGALQSLSDTALAYMQEIVPVDTGALKESCFVQVLVVGTRVQVVIGANTPYAVYVELGTSKNAAQPYIRPTYDLVLRLLPGVIKAEVARRGR